MKRKLYYILIMFVLITLVGCNNSSSSDELVIKLDSNPTTGYEWIYEVSDDNYIRIDETYKSDCTDDIEGCGGQQIYKIKGLKEGKITLIFKYERAWEDIQPIYTAKYELTIDKNLNVTETHNGTYFESD